PPQLLLKRDGLGSKQSLPLAHARPPCCNVAVEGTLDAWLLWRCGKNHTTGGSLALCGKSHSADDPVAPSLKNQPVRFFDDNETALADVKRPTELEAAHRHDHLPHRLHRRRHLRGADRPAGDRHRYSPQDRNAAMSHPGFHSLVLE